VSRDEQREAAATLRHEEAEIEDTTPSGRRLSREEQAAQLSASERESQGPKKA
jgi:hypothetical protein